MYESAILYKEKKVKKLRHVTENLNHQQAANVLHSLNKKNNWDLSISNDYNYEKQDQLYAPAARATKSKKIRSKKIVKHNQIKEVKISYANETNKEFSRYY